MNDLFGVVSFLGHGSDLLNGCVTTFDLYQEFQVRSSATCIDGSLVADDRQQRSLLLSCLLPRPETSVGIVAVIANKVFIFIRDLVHEQPQPLQCRQELVVAFKCGVQLGAVDHHAGLLVVAHLVERKRATDHVAGKALAPVCIGSLDLDAVVHGEYGSRCMLD